MRIHAALLPIVLISACGGSGPPEISVPSTSADIGCTQEYYQTMMGTYTGNLTLNEPGENPRACSWETTFAILGTSSLTQCVLRATTSAVVTQMTFYPEDDIRRYQCLDDSGERVVTEPIGRTFPIEVLPNLDNSNYPVEIDVSTNSLIDRGPYLGDEAVIARYVNLFDGLLTSIAERIIVEGDGTMSIRRSTGETLGTLIKEP